jgi:hypothetical protein
MSERLWVKRRGQPITDNMPFYAYIGSMDDKFIVEYCGQIKLLDRADYELVQP